MQGKDAHPSDQDILLELDGELSAAESGQVRAHLVTCWKCRARRQELEGAIADFVRAQEHSPDVNLPPAAGPRALLKARLALISAASARPVWSETWWRLSRPLAAAACAVLAVGFLVVRPGGGGKDAPPMQAAIVSVPNPSITPGATVIRTRSEICISESAKNKEVSTAVQRKVLAAYGIPGAELPAYEVDYLITPALGGADDIRNLWPQSYSSTVWNALVKDALEDRLRELVCDGSLDLATAQQEIAGNWIAAYKKYFHTDRPIEHVPERQVQFR